MELSPISIQCICTFYESKLCSEIEIATLINYCEHILHIRYGVITHCENGLSL